MIWVGSYIYDCNAQRCVVSMTYHFRASAVDYWRALTPGAEYSDEHNESRETERSSSCRRSPLHLFPNEHPLIRRREEE
jgi:hypothetical protein